MKRWLSLLIVLLLTLSLLSGCKTAPQEAEGAVADNWIGVETGGGEEDPEKEPSDKEEAPEKEPSEGNSQKDPAEENTAPDDKKDPAVDASADNGEDPADGDGEKPGTTVPDEGSTQDPEGEEALPPITKEESGTAITIMAQNLRHSGGDYGDPTYYDGATYNLYNRSRRFRESVKQNDPDVILASEGRPGWLQFFDTDPYIAQTYAYIFQNRGPDVPGGEEGTPVLYKRAKYDLVDKGHFWYSSTPNVMSSYPSTIAYNRVCSWVKLRDKNTGSVFYAYSVHLHIDGENSTFHIRSFRQLVQLTQKMEDADYAFFGGDFNVNYRQETYNDIMDWDHIIDLRDMAQAMEAEALCEVLPIQGSLAHGWQTNEPDTKKNENSRQIDYVMAKPNPRMAVDYYGFEYDMLSDSAAGVEPGYISDHYGLIVKVRIDTDVDYSRYQKEFEGE